MSDEPDEWATLDLNPVYAAFASMSTRLWNARREIEELKAQLRYKELDLIAEREKLAGSRKAFDDLNASWRSFSVARS